MIVKITTNKGSGNNIQTAIGMLYRYIDRGNKEGKKFGILEVQQYGGMEYRFFIWHTKASYFIEITGSIYKNFDTT